MLDERETLPTSFVFEQWGREESWAPPRVCLHPEPPRSFIDEMLQKDSNAGH